jgi:hypothetical protein
MIKVTNINYCIAKKNNFNKMILNINSLDGLDITPKNSYKYDGIVVSKLVVINHLFIEQILKKKLKRKLEIYLKFIIDYMSDGEEDGGALNEILNDIKRYKQILNYRYSKYLDEKYMDSLMKKFDLLEKEFEVKLFIINEKENSLEEEMTTHRTR